MTGRLPARLRRILPRRRWWSRRSPAPPTATTASAAVSPVATATTEAAQAAAPASLLTEMAQYQDAGGQKLSGYLARPQDESPKPAAAVKEIQSGMAYLREQKFVAGPKVGSASFVWESRGFSRDG
ncbi:MAG: hypothetical protein U0401_26800 [Anaerolineae bacterium]